MLLSEQPVMKELLWGGVDFSFLEFGRDIFLE